MPIGKDHWLTQWLERLPDLAHAGLWTVVRPVHHFARGVLVYDAVEGGGFRGVWRIANLWAFDWSWQLQDTIGYETPSPRGTTVVVIEKIPPPIPDALFQQQLVQNTLPFLRSVNSMEQLHRLFMARREPDRLDPVQHFRIELAMGNFAAARELVSSHRDEWFGGEVDYFDEDEVERTRLLCALLDSEDYRGIARVFHKWEATVAEGLELEAVWEPSPFPFEEDYEEWVRRSQHSRS